MAEKDLYHRELRSHLGRKTDCQEAASYERSFFRQARPTWEDFEVMAKNGHVPQQTGKGLLLSLCGYVLIPMRRCFPTLPVVYYSERGC